MKINEELLHSSLNLRTNGIVNKPIILFLTQRVNNRYPPDPEAQLFRRRRQ